MNDLAMQIKRSLQGRLGIAFLILIGMTPLLWLRQGYIIAKGDYFPLWLNPHKTLSSDIYLWAPHHMGSTNTLGSFIVYELIWLFLRYLGLGVEFIQILLQVFFFMGAGLSMYYLSKTVYPNLKLSPQISSIFYMFNFFVLHSRLNIGFAWTYTFLPLSMALLIKIIEAIPEQKTKVVKKYIIYFAFTLTITLSFASINPANIAIIIPVLAITILYQLITQERQNRSLLLNMAKTAVILILLNLWWAIPILNYYLLSPLTLNPEISVTTWAWTHSRASFLNLFWLNGVWGWRSEYVPYIDSYSNPLLTMLVFVPFLAAASALLFKTQKSSFNAYIMLSIIVFTFLAKGLHEPLSQLNNLLYMCIPGMAMFREPVSKFTMAIMPFLALLIGYAVHHVANIKVGKHKPTNLTKTLVASFFILTFVIGTFPLLTNPIETKTAQLPFSSYVKIPDYWYEATDWLNSQPGHYKILIAPPNDFYAMPYTWGYYGTEEFLARFIQKPILLAHHSPYRINPDTAATLACLGKTIACNKTAEFKGLLDLLNIKYIVQRNDIQHNFTGRNIISRDEMRTFLTQQPYIHLAQKFGQLDIYEYINPKPYIYILDPPTLRQTTIKIQYITTLNHTWNFNAPTELQEWQNATLQNQFGVDQNLTLDNGALKAELWNSTWGWKTINSPLLPAQYGDTYQIQADIKGKNAHEVHTKMAEYNQNKKIIATIYTAYINDGTFDCAHTTFNYELTSKTTKYLQIQIWHDHETPKSFPKIIWIDNVQIHGYTTILNTTGLNLIFQNTTQNQPATILNYKKINPTKIRATINATQPLILAISEALDQSWKAHTNGKQLKAIPLYLGLKGFYINETGQLEITIEYEPQKWFYYGSIISVTTFLACLTYLTYNWTKNKNIWKRTKRIVTRIRLRARSG